MSARPRFRDLINRFGSAEAALEMLPELVISGGAARLPRIPTQAKPKPSSMPRPKHGARLVGIGEADYPPMLRRMDQPPPILAVKGEANVFALPPIAIVGARNASLAGIKLARILAAELGARRLCHRLRAWRAASTRRRIRAASPPAPSRCWPAGSTSPTRPRTSTLPTRSAERGGAAISEMPFGWEPRARDFPRRNRLIAGLSLGLVVIEAANRSGSLISARLAGEMGRLVFAVPGSPLDPRAAGSNGLLKDGAILVTEARDVLDQIAPLAGMRHRAAGGQPGSTSRRIFRRRRRPATTTAPA